MSIAERYNRIRGDIPGNVTIVAAAKTRSVEEVRELIEAGATDIGENYVQEGSRICTELGELKNKVNWHIIGHLQSNKINKALQFCDVIQTIESPKKAETVNKRVAQAGKNVLPVYIEVNIGNEYSKHGIKPEYPEILSLAEKISQLKHIKLEGLMTLGPVGGDVENVRPFFKKMRTYYEKLKALDLPNTNIQTLSMGMTNSYKVAIDEGSNMVRIGTALFGSRQY